MNLTATQPSGIRLGFETASNHCVGIDMAEGGGVHHTQPIAFTGVKKQVDISVAGARRCHVFSSGRRYLNIVSCNAPTGTVGTEYAMMKGYIQVYTGDGKGKTTAALGLSLRAAGAGLSVYFTQFIKQGDYSEITALKSFSNRITVEQFGRGRFITGTPAPEDVAAARTGLEKIRAAMISGAYDVIVLDEANGAVQTGLFPVSTLLEIMDAKPDGLELVITGRNAHEEVLARADLVTEMKEIKHYYKSGVSARTGIEK